MVNTRGKLTTTSPTKILDMIINAIPLSTEDLDSMTTSYNLDPNFVVIIPTNKNVEPINHNINCHTKGSKLGDNRTGAGVLKKPFISATMRLCFKLKYLQWEKQHPTLYSPEQKKSVVINCDSQAAVMALRKN